MADRKNKFAHKRAKETYNKIKDKNMRFSVDQEILQAVLNFLVEQPYKQTSVIIAKLQADAKPVKEEKQSEQEQPSKE